MASIINRPNGHRWVQFIATDGKRKTLRFGKISKRTADEYKRRIELLLEARLSNSSPDRDTARWAADLPLETHRKISAVGLVADREEIGAITLGAFLDSYIVGRPDVKKSTATVYGHTARCLKTLFGPSTPLNSITLADADRWRAWLATKANVRDEDRDGLSENTIRRRCMIAKQFFRHAVKRGLLTDNPFRELRGQTRGNAARQFFVDREAFYKVIGACPDSEWRCIVALARLGGLRVPSELFALKWSDVNLPEGRFVVHASKTEHHEGGGVRVVPIFPELRPFLEEAYELAKDGAEFVIDRHRVAGGNLRTRFEKIILRAGLKPWPKLFQNLRSSRQTELLDKHPVKAVCQWLGNSQAVAMEHYAQVTEAHFKAAMDVPTGVVIEGEAQAEAVNPKNEKQKAKQQVAASSRNLGQETKKALDSEGQIQSLAKSCMTTQTSNVGDAGLEPATCTL